LLLRSVHWRILDLLFLKLLFILTEVHFHKWDESKDKEKLGLQNSIEGVHCFVEMLLKSQNEVFLRKAKKGLRGAKIGSKKSVLEWRSAKTIRRAPDKIGNVNKSIPPVNQLPNAFS
jgi:hypothetical protein